MPSKMGKDRRKLGGQPVTKQVSGGTSSTSPRGKVLTKDDGIYSFVGIGAGKVPGGISTKKHAYCK